MIRAAFMPKGAMRVGRVAALLVLLVGDLLIPVESLAAWGESGQVESVKRSAPDWVSDDLAGQLSLTFDVLVPPSVPAPFEGSPSVTAYEGYYSLYWMIPGTPPTFLQISGEVGGQIPDYSKYDRNNQLEQNATVGGVPAYHDLTPIYDLVYWEVGGVVYSVESQNLSEENSLGIANSLISLEAGGGAGAEPTVQSAPATLSLSCPESVASGERLEFTLSGSGDAIIDAGAGFFPAESPNVEFAPENGGGRTMVGTVPNAGTATLAWAAPEIDEPATFYLFATNVRGETTGECAIEVVPLSATERGGSSGDAEVGGVAAVGSDPEGAEEPDRQQEQVSDEESEESNDGENKSADTEEEQAADEESPTEIPNEVIGIPTPDPDGEAEEPMPSPSPSPTPNLTPTVRPTATIAPTISEDGMAATIMGSEGGTLSSSRGATVVIPPGALSEQATLSIVPVASTKLPVDDGVDLIANSAFDISIAGPNGLALENELSPPAELHIDLGEDGMREGARIYRVQGLELVPLANTRIEGNTLVVTVDRFSRFVAGVPATVQGAENRSLLPFILAAVVVVLIMIGMIVLGGMFRPRRHRVVTTRRPPRQTRYR